MKSMMLFVPGCLKTLYCIGNIHTAFATLVSPAMATMSFGEVTVTALRSTLVVTNPRPPGHVGCQKCILASS